MNGSLTNAGAISGESDLVRDLKAELVDLAASTLRRPVRSGMVVTLMIAGLGLAFAGWAWSALLIVAAVGVSGWVDRRLPLLLAALAAPGLTALGVIDVLNNAYLCVALGPPCWGVCGATIAAVAPTAPPEALARLFRRLPGSTRLLPELTTAESGEKG